MKSEKQELRLLPNYLHFVGRNLHVGQYGSNNMILSRPVKLTWFGKLLQKLSVKSSLG